MISEYHTSISLFDFIHHKTEIIHTFRTSIDDISDKKHKREFSMFRILCLKSLVVTIKISYPMTITKYEDIVFITERKFLKRLFYRSDFFCFHDIIFLELCTWVKRKYFLFHDFFWDISSESLLFSSFISFSSKFSIKCESIHSFPVSKLDKVFSV